MDKKHIASAWYFVGVFLLLMALQNYVFAPRVDTLSYAEFKTLVEKGKVSDVAIGGQLITGRLKLDGVEGLLPKTRIEELIKSGTGDHQFMTVKVDDPTLVHDLQQANVNFRGEVTSTWIPMLLSWVLPMGFFFLIWRFALKKMGGGGLGGLMTLGKSKAKVYVQKDTGVTFGDVAGIDEAKAELVEVVEFLKTPERFQRLGGKIPKGVLLVGVPGTGKTLLAKAVAGEAKVPFFSLSGSDFVEMFVGVGAARVRDLFAQAVQHAPSIIFIDELDALGKARGMNPLGGHDEREQTLNQLLVEMDGFETNKGVIIMAATNRPEILDPALLRPGRFDRQVLVDRPDLKGREAILRVHAKGVTVSPEVDLAAIAAKTFGFVGADLANIVNEAALLAARQGKEAVERADFDEAIDRVVAGLKKTRVMSAKEREIVATHEAGHAVAAECLPGTDPVVKVSIVSRGIAALGYTQQLPTEDRYLMTRSELFNRLCVLLGGRTAEEIIFGDVSTGAQNDLQRATDLVRHMVGQYGMSDKVGLMTFDGGGRPGLLPGLSPPREHSEETARLLDAEAGRILGEAHVKVSALLTDRRSFLEQLARRLLEKEVVEGDELHALLAGATRP
ncbi:MAG: ATP-dependent zinc metalloprotease FtsH [candidate division NC10 bacterium]|nr:ATP-dependent zinc metalloprotease FtsH [candidate division NC10 bacterium]